MYVCMYESMKFSVLKSQFVLDEPRMSFGSGSVSVHKLRRRTATITIIKFQMVSTIQLYIYL